MSVSEHAGPSTPQLSLNIQPAAAKHDNEAEHRRSMERPLRFFRSPIEESAIEFPNMSSTSTLDVGEASASTSTEEVSPQQESRKDSSSEPVRDNIYDKSSSLEDGRPPRLRFLSRKTLFHRKTSTDSLTPKHYPPLHRHAEATPSELFYDLWFVANLATYTTQNKAINIRGLSNYIGFFCILWFTWCQVALYDVRLGRDSVFDRLCKVGQFGVMAGFSFVAYLFDPAGAKAADGGNGFVDGKALSLVLMSSRLILFFQYLASLYCLWKFKETRYPLVIIAISSLVAAFIFLGMSFMFETDGSKSDHDPVYITWYIVSVVETIVSIAVSCTWRALSFKGTHLVERMSLLTLICLGEGIIGLSKAIVTVWRGTYFFPGLGAAVASVIILIYSLYQLYFDTIHRDHFGTIRQQIWAFLHFPLHLGIVLFDEGSKQFVIWIAATRQQCSFIPYISSVPLYQLVSNTPPNGTLTLPQNSTEYFTAQASLLQSSFQNFTTSPSGLGAGYSTNTTALSGDYATIATGHTQPPAQLLAAVNGFYSTITTGIFANFQIATDAPAAAPLQLYDMVYAYFYAATGLTLLLLLGMWLLTKRDAHSRYDCVRFGVWGVVGAVVAGLAAMDASAVGAQAPGYGFVNGPWVLPLPAVLIAGVVVVYHLPFGLDGRRGSI